MQYTDNEAALIGGLISTYFFQPAVSASLKDAYSRVLEHLHQNALTSSDLQQIRKAVSFLMNGTQPPGMPRTAALCFGRGFAIMK